MAHTPTPYRVVKGFGAPEIVSKNGRRIAIVLLEGGSEGMEEAIHNAEFIRRACNAYRSLKRENGRFLNAARLVDGSAALTDRGRYTIAESALEATQNAIDNRGKDGAK